LAAGTRLILEMSTQQQRLRRAGLALGLAFLMAVAFSLVEATRRGAATRSRLSSAEQQLTALADRAGDGDGDRRAAIAWGYSELLRLGLESPFRLIDAAASDPRLTDSERRTVSWALLSHVLRGESHQVDPAALDQLHANGAPGEAHLALIDDAVARAHDPRAAELAIRLAYTLAAAERRVDGIAPLLAAEAAALSADREIARREARALVRSAGDRNPIELIQRRRARRDMYVERPVLLSPTEELEDAAIAMTGPLLDRIRTLHGAAAPAIESSRDDHDVGTRLFAAGARVPPDAPLMVTVQRYLPLLRGRDNGLDTERLARAANGEMLIGALRDAPADRAGRRNRGRLLLAAAVAMRSLAQTPRWLEAGAANAEASAVASALGLSGIDFDGNVPREWRPYYLQRLSGAVADLRQVLPGLSLDAVRVRFRMRAPADSALAMHDPRSRTLHLPVGTAGGTVAHELAHDLDRQSAIQAGLAGYRSDIASRSAGRQSRVAASLRALTEELSGTEPSTAKQRPAEVFATRVDWFVAQALAREGISNGFLSAVQDELLTGHVVHPDRLRGAGRSRSLLTALEEMTTVASRARADASPSAETVLRWALAAPVDRAVAAAIMNGTAAAPLLPCDGEPEGRAQLVRLAAESRARGWTTQRARWIEASDRPDWARAVLGEGPWREDGANGRIGALREHILLQLSSADELPAGLSAYGSPLALAARCGEI
jgi:hypothetical protein